METRSSQTLQVMQRFNQAFLQHDPSLLDGLIAEDCVMESVEPAPDGIDRFLILGTCVGVRPGELYAPNGLALLYDGVLSMNPLSALFERKASSYLARWPWLQVQPAAFPAESGIDLHGCG